MDRLIAQAALAAARCQRQAEILPALQAAALASRLA
jgi:hypothetical protein